MGFKGMGPVVQGLGVGQGLDFEHHVVVKIRLAVVVFRSNGQEFKERAQGIDGAVDRGRRIKVSLLVLGMA